VIREAVKQGKRIHVFVDETRPLLQGARLTAYELQKDRIPYTIICDNMAATLMRQGKVQRIFVGADRIALNGDFANKIGMNFPIWIHISLLWCECFLCLLWSIYLFIYFAGKGHTRLQ
jgi:hypothetical protein